VQGKMDIYCYLRTHNLTITAAGAFAGIGDNRHLFFLVPAKHVQGAVFIAGATPIAMPIVDLGTIIDVSFIHYLFLL
jgi:hypothetical protein